MSVTIINSDCISALNSMPEKSVHMCVTSPPYWGLRDYGHDRQLGQEATPQEYVDKMVQVFNGVKRVLKDNGTLWLNLGDSYSNAGTRQGDRGGTVSGGTVNDHRKINNGYKPRAPGFKNKDLIGIPWRVAFALQADGWYLRQDIIWAKPNPMPESVKDRCTRSHEYIFMLSKSADYFYDSESSMEDAVSTDRKKWTDNGSEKQRGHGRRHAGFNGRYAENILTNGAPTKRNRRDVWNIAVCPFKGAHFAVFPPKLIEPCIIAGSAPGDTVLDPFGGSGTTGVVAQEHGRNAILIELNPDYAAMAAERCGLTSNDDWT